MTETTALEPGFYWTRSTDKRYHGIAISEWSGKLWHHSGVSAISASQEIEVLSPRLKPPLTLTDPDKNGWDKITDFASLKIALQVEVRRRQSLELLVLSDLGRLVTELELVKALVQQGSKDVTNENDTVGSVIRTSPITLLGTSPLGYGGWYQLHDGISERSDELELRISSKGTMEVEVCVGGIGASKTRVMTVSRPCAITLVLPRVRIVARARSYTGVQIELRSVA